MNDWPVWTAISHGRAIRRRALYSRGGTWFHEIMSTHCNVVAMPAPITLFSGTHDIINAGARSLARKARAADFPLDHHEAPGMLHVYPLPPIPEGAAARAVMEEILTSCRSRPPG